jgi:autotransporter-associated beta strand protein
VTANLGGGAANLVFDGGILQITGTTLANFSGIGHTVSFNATKTVGLDINNVAHTFTVDQVLNQTTGGFTKLGAGTVILNQTNTYTGATAVNGGTLRVNTPGLLDANSVVTVAAPRSAAMARSMARSVLPPMAL